MRLSLPHTKLDFGPLVGRRGELLRATVRALVLFKGEKLVAEDTVGSEATIIHQIYVAGVPQLNVTTTWWRRFVSWINRERWNAGIPTLCFSADAVGNGIRMKTATVGQDIDIDVEFLDDATWKGSILGSYAPAGGRVHAGEVSP